MSLNSTTDRTELKPYTRGKENIAVDAVQLEYIKVDKLEDTHLENKEENKKNQSGKRSNICREEDVAIKKDAARCDNTSGEEEKEEEPLEEKIAREIDKLIEKHNNDLMKCFDHAINMTRNYYDEVDNEINTKNKNGIYRVDKSRKEKENDHESKADEENSYKTLKTTKDPKQKTLRQRLQDSIAKPKKKKEAVKEENTKQMWLGVCKKLLERGALADDKYDYGGKKSIACCNYLQAIADESDELGALMLTHMPGDIVRYLHVSNDEMEAVTTIEKLLKADMVKTVGVLLDHLVERPSGGENITTIHFGILDADSSGYTPEKEKFNVRKKSGLHALTYYGNKDLLYYDAVRLFIEHKWNAFGRGRFIQEAIMYIISMFSLTFSAGVASHLPDPLVYDSPLQVTRASFEVFTVVIVLYHLLTEGEQMKKGGMNYWKCFDNYVDLLSILFLLSVMPLRLLSINAQWFFYAFGYICWTLRILKYAPLSRHAGAFVHTLWVIITEDVVQFIVLFTIILVAFSGSFTLAHRGEGKLAELNYTRSVFGYMFIGIRTLVEQQPVITYTNKTDNTKNFFSILIMILYLSTCVIILLNLIIAQMTETFQRVRYECQRDVEFSRARIITRIEQNTLLSCCYRKRWYESCVRKENYKAELLRWENPPLDSHERVVLDIKDKVDRIHDCLNRSDVESNTAAHDDNSASSSRNQLQDTDVACSDKHLNSKLDSLSKSLKETKESLKETKEMVQQQRQLLEKLISSQTLLNPSCSPSRYQCDESNI